MFSHYIFQQINHKKLSINKSQRADFQSKKKGLSISQSQRYAGVYYQSQAQSINHSPSDVLLQRAFYPSITHKELNINESRRAAILQ